MSVRVANHSGLFNISEWEGMDSHMPPSPVNPECLPGSPLQMMRSLGGRPEVPRVQGLSWSRIQAEVDSCQEELGPWRALSRALVELLALLTSTVPTW